MSLSFLIPTNAMRVPGMFAARDGGRHHDRTGWWSATPTAERDEQRPDVMHAYVLQPIEKEHVLRKILEPTLHHRVDDQHSGKKRDLTQYRRPMLRRGRTLPADVPPQPAAPPRGPDTRRGDDGSNS